MTFFSMSALPAKRFTKSFAIVFDRLQTRFARAASGIFRSPKMASGSRSGEPALDSMQHSVLPAASRRPCRSQSFAKHSPPMLLAHFIGDASTNRG
jgi:hypothetical protein